MTGAWTRREGKNPEGGLNAKGRASLRAEGHNIKPPVSSKEAAHSKAKASRRKSFCARMEGMKRNRTSAETAHDPNSRINKSLRKWDCHKEVGGIVGGSAVKHAGKKPRAAKD